MGTKSQKRPCKNCGPEHSTPPQTPRQKSNRELLKILSRLIEDYPDLRFSQILFAFDFTILDKEHGMKSGGIPWLNEFYTEPSAVLSRVKAALKERS